MILVTVYKQMIIIKYEVLLYNCEWINCIR